MTKPNYPVGKACKDMCDELGLLLETFAVPDHPGASPLEGLTEQLIPKDALLDWLIHRKASLHPKGSKVRAKDIKIMHLSTEDRAQDPAQSEALYIETPRRVITVQTNMTHKPDHLTVTDKESTDILLEARDALGGLSGPYEARVSATLPLSNIEEGRTALANYLVKLTKGDYR